MTRILNVHHHSAITQCLQYKALQMFQTLTIFAESLDSSNTCCYLSANACDNLPKVNKQSTFFSVPVIAPCHCLSQVSDKKRLTLRSKSLNLSKAQKQAGRITLEDSSCFQHEPVTHFCRKDF